MEWGAADETFWCPPLYEGAWVFEEGNRLVTV